MTARHRIPLFSILCLLAIYTSAQTFLASKVRSVVDIQSSIAANQSPQKKDTIRTPGKTMLIKLENSDEIIKRKDSEIQILKYNVVFLHNGAHLYCDSAYYSEADNSFEAFSNVKMDQGDTLFLYGNYMFYDGNTQLIYVRQNVRLENNSATLFTDSLNYDRLANIGYYFDGGMLVDSLNELTSFWGQYEPNRKIALFSDSVKLINPKFTLYSDTLKYNTETKIATILSPTKIESDSGYIYSSRGWYNTTTEESVLLDQSSVINKSGDRILRGDSIAYNKAKQFGEVFGNMFLQDTTKKVILIGNYGYYDEKSSFALATDSAYSIEYSQKDSLFLHADTLKLVTDSIFRDLKAYYGVRFYRSDLQGVCDSMLFSSRDSVLRLYKDPILWNGTNQISGDTIDIFMNDSTIEYAHIKGYSFSIEAKDSIHFNQLKGRSMKVFFNNKDVDRIFVEGNAEAIFYPEEKDKSLTGLNKVESSYIDIYVKERKLYKVKTWSESKGVMIPIQLIKPTDLRLANFYWYDYMKPLDRNDIFRKVKKKATDIRPPRAAIFNREE